MRKTNSTGMWKQFVTPSVVLSFVKSSAECSWCGDNDPINRGEGVYQGALSPVIRKGAS